MNWLLTSTLLLAATIVLRWSMLCYDISSVSIPVTFSSASYDNVLFASLSQHEPDTTAVLLNWSRLPNVVRIVKILCGDMLNDTIATVVVWNNNPRPLTHKDFARSQCPRRKLLINNSPTNTYFHARFLACSNAVTKFCFIQDDDYLVRPQILKMLHHQIARSVDAKSIHLLPPGENLSKDLLTIDDGHLIHASFAWLGYGTIMHRSRARDFLALMNFLNVSAEEMKMADNYFTILSNIYPETWFDQGIELPSNNAFTVGSEGEMRNRRHITRATELLDFMVAGHDIRHVKSALSIPYIKTGKVYPRRHRYAPCSYAECLLETSIKLIPDSINSSVSNATSIFKVEAENSRRLTRGRRFYYVKHPPSMAVDGDPNTAFCSYGRAQQGDTISLKLPAVRCDTARIELAFLVNMETEEILRHSVFETGSENDWSRSTAGLSCVDSDIFASHAGALFLLRECSMVMVCDAKFKEAPAFRARLVEDMEERWCVYEAWLRGRTLT